MKWLKRLGLAALALLVLVAAAAAWYGKQVLPVTQGRIALAGARAELRIERDSHGIPSVQATNLHDAYFGLGVVHAQDRLWQLETHRRIGAGRMAELFGEPALQADRFLRALGVRRAAAAQWQQLGPEPRAALVAYTAGINAVISSQLHARPPEYLLLGTSPEPWDPIDSLAWGIMMAWDLGGNWTTELLRMRLALQMPVARINELMPAYPGEEPRPRPITRRCIASSWTPTLASMADAAAPGAAFGRRRRRLQQLGAGGQSTAAPASRCWPTTRTSS
jgi:penicillin amidase